MSRLLISERDFQSRQFPPGVLTPMNTLLFGSGEPGAWYDPSDLSTLFQDSAGTTPVTAVEQPVGLMLDKSGRGNHASQATSTKRPRYSRRVNFAPASDDLTSALWTSKGRSSVSNISVSNPRGLALVSKIIPDTQANPHLVEAPGSLTGNRTIRCVVKAAGWDCVALLSYGSAVGAQFNLTTGVASSYVGTTTNRSITPLGGGWFSISCDVDAVLGGTSIRVGLSNSFSAVGNGSDGVLVCGVETVVSRASSFQSVNTDTDYDADPAKFPGYLRFDGVDDALQTGNIDFTGTDKMTVWAGVTKLSDAAAGMLLESSANWNVNNGVFIVLAPGSPGDCQFGSEGTSQVVISRSGFQAPINAILSMSANIGGPSLVSRINGVSSAVSTSSQGTGNYGNYPLYIGARAGTSLFFNGRLYQLIVRGAQSSLSQIEATELYIKRKMRLP